MHSYWNRLNTTLTFFGTVAAVLCVLVTVTDLFHTAHPDVNVKLLKVKQLGVHRNKNDQTVLSLKLDADLRSAFSWNTKQLFVYVQAEYSTPDNHVNQIVLWDQIVERPADAHIRVRNLKQEYAFIDQGHNLRSRDVNITVAWNVMPKVGRLYIDSRSFAVGARPQEYSF
jgi:signal peptidase complex subunit 3